MRFELATATRIVFGRGTLAELGELCAALGRRALIVTGSNPARSKRALALLAERGISNHTLHVSGEPTTEDARRGVELARSGKCDLVIGIGGGSALDAGKAVAALLTNGGDPLDYLEVIGKGRLITRRSAPYVAVPTTAGTGSEVTRNAVLEAPEHQVKVSLRSHLMLPEVALVDPTEKWPSSSLSVRSFAPRNPPNHASLRHRLRTRRQAVTIATGVLPCKN